MNITPILALLTFASFLGCQTAAPLRTKSAPKVDLSAPPVISAYEEGGIKVHTFIAPEVSEQVTSHIIETAHGLVVIDTQMLRPYAKQLRAFADSLKKPITHVIVSHGHPDHYFGLEFFSDVPTYATADTIARMHARSPGHQAGHKAKEGDDVIDTIVYPTHELLPGTLSIDGVAFDIAEVEGGEDVKQTIVWVRQAKTLVVQDLAAGHFHAFTGTLLLDAWAQLLVRLEKEATDGGITHVLPGHGTPGGPAILAETRAYLATAGDVFSVATSQADYIRGMKEAYPGLGGSFIIEVSAMIWDRDRH